MNWINNVIEDIQHKILLKTGKNPAQGMMTHAAPPVPSDTSEQVRKFQCRLCDLDKRLLELR
ncbi:MAG: hypothetical protein M0R76_03645 [Proteobacteria bacterium]|jgi:hypothetical protein|nr:hypothetical protein [Pseudomonadota bacterium]NLN63270.1 hypothetical protein [Myxococcales bacterium]